MTFASPRIRLSFRVWLLLELHIAVLVPILIGTLQLAETSALVRYCDPVNDNSGALVSCGQNKWCCEPDYSNGHCNCQNGDGTFSVSNGHALTIIGVNNLIHTATAASATLPSTSTATTNSSSSTTSGTHTSPPSPSPTQPSSNVETSNSFVIGMSAGFGILGILLIIALCFAYYKRSIRTGTFRFWEWRRDIGGTTGMAGRQPPVIPRYEPPITRDNPYLAHMESNPFHNSMDSIELDRAGWIGPSTNTPCTYIQ